MRISDWSSDVCSSDLINATLPESPTKKAPRVRSRWGALCNERERARRPGIAQSYHARTSSGSYPGWPRKQAIQARCLGADGGQEDRKSAVEGKRGSVGVDFVGTRILKQNIL